MYTLRRTVVYAGRAPCGFDVSLWRFDVHRAIQSWMGIGLCILSAFEPCGKMETIVVIMAACIYFWLEFWCTVIAFRLRRRVLSSCTMLGQHVPEASIPLTIGDGSRWISPAVYRTSYESKSTSVAALGFQLAARSALQLSRGRSQINSFSHLIPQIQFFVL